MVGTYSVVEKLAKMFFFFMFKAIAVMIKSQAHLFRNHENLTSQRFMLGKNYNASFCYL